MKKRKRKARSNRRGGLTAKQWKALRARVIKAQGNKCAMPGCEAPGHDGPSKKVRGVTIRRLYLDHDHKTGRVRGALCFRCNHRLLGRGLEDWMLHWGAAKYLKSTRDWRTYAQAA